MELFNELLDEAQRRLGPRDNTWCIGSVVAEGDNFPEVTISAPGVLKVRVTRSTLHYPLQAIFQRSHEAIHCLAPVIKRDTIWFEEGLANHYSLTLPRLPADYRAESEKIVPSLFIGPLAAFRSLNATDEAIRRLREEQATFDLLKPALIQKYFGASDELANQLCRRLPVERPAKL